MSPRKPVLPARARAFIERHRGKILGYGFGVVLLVLISIVGVRGESTRTTVRRTIQCQNQQACVDFVQRLIAAAAAINPDLLVGRQGPTGPVGPQGPAGHQGRRGRAGSAQGTLTQPSSGARGTRGRTGARGSAGAQGAPGAPGKAGPVGPSGTVNQVDEELAQEVASLRAELARLKAQVCRIAPAAPLC
jgi:hypothetical protein